MLLKDQYPISIDKSIEIDCVDNGGVSVNSEAGGLTWKIKVKLGETKTYQFVVKHPKDRIVKSN